MTEELSLQCHYKVFLNFHSTTYYFFTDTGAEYEVLFIDSAGIFTSTLLEDCEVFNIVINKTKSGTGKRDPEIAITIEAVLEHFFSDKNRILLYTCDSLDDKHLLRNRLFNMWFDKSRLKDSFEKLNHQFENVDPVYYASMIFHKENDLGSVTIISTFEEVISLLSESK